MRCRPSLRATAAPNLRRWGEGGWRARRAGQAAACRPAKRCDCVCMCVRGTPSGCTSENTKKVNFMRELCRTLARRVACVTVGHEWKVHRCEVTTNANTPTRTHQIEASAAEALKRVLGLTDVLVFSEVQRRIALASAPAPHPVLFFLASTPLFFHPLLLSSIFMSSVDCSYVCAHVLDCREDGCASVLNVRVTALQTLAGGGRWEMDRTDSGPRCVSRVAPSPALVRGIVTVKSTPHLHPRCTLVGAPHAEAGPQPHRR
jgi:hypothetical protein